MSSETIAFIGSDGKKIEVDEIVAFECDYIRFMFKVDEYDERELRRLACLKQYPCHIRYVSTDILSMVFDYCKKHVDKTLSDDDLKTFDSEFVKVDNRTLILLVIAAETMTISNLVDLTCQAVVNIINDMTPEEICKTLDIKNDFTSQEVIDTYVSHGWAFQERKLKNETVSTEFARLTEKEKEKKEIMDENSFLQKVLPILTPAGFAYLTPEEKREWVLVAVLVPHMRKILASAQYEYDPADDEDDEEREMSDLEEKLAEEEEVKKIGFDLTDLVIKELKDENFGRKNRVFQLFSVRVDFGSDKEGRLYGLIEAKGYGSTEFVSVFNRGEDESESQPIYNMGLVSLSDPSPNRLISANGNINVSVQLFVCVDDSHLKLALAELYWDCSRREYNRYFNHFQKTVIKEYDGCVKLYYIVLDDPVEACVEVSFDTSNTFRACGHIKAYYDDLDSYFLSPDHNGNVTKGGDEYSTVKCARDEIEFCKATLFEAGPSDPILLEDGKISLKRSKLVVPNGGSLVLEVNLRDVSTPTNNISRILKFDSKVDSMEYTIRGSDWNMCLKVDWNNQRVEVAKNGS